MIDEFIILIGWMDGFSEGRLFCENKDEFIIIG